MPVILINALIKMGGILAPIIAEMGWRLMTERMIRNVCGTTVLWIQETWFPIEEYPKGAPLLIDAATLIKPPPVVK